MSNPWLRILVCAGCLFAPVVGKAEASTPETLRINHITPPPEALGNPGELMELSFALDNTKSFDFRLKALLILDGKLMEIQVPEGRPNIQDRPIYTVPFFSPLKDLTYRFILTKDDRVVGSTDWVTIQRRCLPDLSPVDTAKAKADGKTETLIEAARNLKRDLGAYRESTRLLETILSVVEPGGAE